MKPLAARVFARPLTAPSTAAPLPLAQIARELKWGIFKRHFWGNFARR